MPIKTKSHTICVNSKGIFHTSSSKLLIIQTKNLLRKVEWLSCKVNYNDEATTLSRLLL